MKYLIYGLYDPRTGDCRYIGKSSSGLDRPKDHGRSSTLRYEDTYKSRWIKELLSQGLSYDIKVLEEPTREELSNAEIRWIEEAQASARNRIIPRWANTST